MRKLERGLNSESRQLQQYELKMAGMMVCTVTIFVACNSFNSIYFILWSHGYYDEDDEDKKLAKKLWVSTSFFTTLNSSIIGVIYSIFSEKFRKIFYNLFCVGTSKNSHVLVQSQPATEIPRSHLSQRKLGTTMCHSNEVQAHPIPEVRRF